MLILEGKNLCERQKEINFKVNEAARNNVQLETVSPESSSDVDRIFKIDLASKYKDIKYVVGELKLGDSLFISRALKCEWLYDSEHAHIINPDYLHHNVFPSMSLKMQRKMLTAISMHVKDEGRAQQFYEYCINCNMRQAAYKFLIFTSELFKEKIMNDDDVFYEIYRDYGETQYFKYLIGNSFKLADIYGQRRTSIEHLRYLYSVNDAKYLDLFEKYSELPRKGAKAGAKCSRSILKKHKDRVLKNPQLYLSFLNEKELLKYSTAEDAMIYLNSLFPKDVNTFWTTDYLRKYNHILNLIKPKETMYKTFKSIFQSKYPEADFEMSCNFYKLKYYDLMTFEEREAWAIDHLEKQSGVIAESEDYRWYGFINFEKSFDEIKKRILITTDLYKRAELISVLIKSAKSQGDLKTLLDYYYNRHVNESRERKEKFLQEFIDQHDVFHLNENCWESLHKIFHSLQIYTSSWPTNQFILVSLIYHVIHGKSLPDGLAVENINIYNLRKHFPRLINTEKDLLYNFFVQFAVTKLTELDSQDYKNEVKMKVRQYIHKFEDYMKFFIKEIKYPDIAIKFMKIDTDHFDYVFQKETEKEVNITEGYLLRCLKNNPSEILEQLPLIKDKCCDSREFRINSFLKKMKIYFSNDIAKLYVDFCLQTLSENLEEDGLLATIYAIFQLSDNETKSNIMDKYAPTSPKIEHDKIERHIYCVQEAICRMHCYSRPPVPLAKTALYIKGDYVHKCDEMFNMYLVNLPPYLRTDFIQLLLDSPLSIQKRGLRLAFQTFESNDLKNIVLSVWKKTKSVSLRNIIYKLLFVKIVKENGKAQENLFAVLQELTPTIHEDDDKGIFDCFNGHQLSENLKGAYLQTAWETVAALSEKKSANNEHKSFVIKALKSNISLIDDSLLLSIITDHVYNQLSRKKLRPESNHSVETLNEAKWDLVAQYIVENPNEAKLEKSLSILKSIVDQCVNNWNIANGSDTYVFQSFFKSFVGTLSSTISYFGTEYLKVVDVYEYLESRIENSFDISEVYSYLWDFKLTIMTIKEVNGKTKMNKQDYIKYGSQLGILVKEMKDSNRFYKYFLGKIVQKVNEFIRALNYVKESNLVQEDVYILVAYGLALTAENETFILALEILPDDLSLRPAVKLELPHVIKTIKERNDTELIAFMKDKFICSDHKVRDLLQRI